MKHIYFVRHGQTAKNVARIHQGPDEPLTAVGKTQAHEVAGLLQTKQIDQLFTSPFVRARETAEIVGEALNLPYSETESVKEFRRPDALYGTPHFSVATFQYLMELFTNQNNPKWESEGAETMFAIRNRVVDARNLLEQAQGQRIAVITHVIFMHLFIQSVCLERPLRMSEFMSAFWEARRVTNTDMVAFTVDETAPGQTCRWRLITEETDPEYLKYR